MKANINETLMLAMFDNKLQILNNSLFNYKNTTTRDSVCWET